MFEFAYNDIVDDSPQAMRAQERRALDQVLELLRAAAKAGHGSRELVTALFQLRRLWGVFLDDLSSPENGLPDALRAGIIPSSDLVRLVISASSAHPPRPLR